MPFIVLLFGIIVVRFLAVLKQFLRLHHFFLKIVKLSVIVEYNAVGVGNIARQIGQMISPANWQGFLHTKEGESLWQLVIRNFGNYLLTKI